MSATAVKTQNKLETQRGNMIINRTDKSDGKDPFTQISNSIIHDSRLELKEKALMLHILSKPENWVLNVDEIVKSSRDGKTSVYAGLKHLKELGYIVLTPIYNQDTKKIDYWEYTINENPGLKLVKSDNLHTEKLLPENQEIENKPYNNINIKKNNYNKNKQTKEIPVSTNEPEKIINFPEQKNVVVFSKEDKLKEEMKKDGFSEDSINTFLNKYKFDKVNHFFKEFLKAKERQEIENPGGWLNSVLKKNEFIHIEPEPEQQPEKPKTEFNQDVLKYFHKTGLFLSNGILESTKIDTACRRLLQMFAVISNDKSIEQMLLNIIGDLSEITPVADIEKIFEEYLKYNPKRKQVTELMSFWKGLVK